MSQPQHIVISKGHAPIIVGTTLDDAMRQMKTKVLDLPIVKRDGIVSIDDYQIVIKFPGLIHTKDDVYDIYKV